MTGRRHMGLVAALATLMASFPLVSVFEQWTWLIQSVLAVAFVGGAATLARILRGPVWAQLIAMVAALVLALTWMFPSGHELLAVLPWGGTFEHFGSLMGEAVRDMRAYAVPVPDTDGLLFMAVLGVGAVAVLVDLVAVGLRRPALAGLPMLAIYSVPVAVFADSVPILPFVIGAMGFLWLLVADKVDSVRRFGRRFTGDGRDVDVWEPSPLAAAGRRLAVVGVALAVLLPVAVPGMTTGLLDRFSTGAGDGAGLGTSNGRAGRVNLFAALAGQLRQSENVVLARVQSTDPTPYYLRFAVADQVTEEGFRGRSPRGEGVKTLPPAPQNPPAGVSYQEYRARVEITDKFEMQLAPTYGQPVQVDGLNNSWAYDPNMQVVFSNRETARKKSYDFDFVRASFTPDALRAAPALNPQTTEVLQYTKAPSVRQVSDRVKDLTAGRATDYDKVMAIYDFFSSKNGFTYDLQTQGGTSGQDIVNFLANKKGFCQQYAAAMAWLVRAAGIPARVAFGFSNGSTREDNGQTFVLTNQNLHAWTEVYFGPAYGWVPFDATPRSGVSGSVRPGWAPDPDAPVVYGPSATPSGSAAGGSSADDGPLSPRQDRELQPGDGGSLTQSRTMWPFYALGILIVLLALVATPALRRTLLRRRRQAITSAAGSAPPQDVSPGVATVLVTGAAAQRVRADTHAAWDELVDTLVDYRVPIDPTETPRATAERLAVSEFAGGDAAESARLLGRAEERARYAREPMAGTGLTAALRAVRRALAVRSTRRTRIVATLLPPSVLGRWKAALVDRATTAVTVTSQIRDSLVRWSPRRLLTNRAR